MSHGMLPQTSGASASQNTSTFPDLASVTVIVTVIIRPAFSKCSGVFAHASAFSIRISTRPACRARNQFQSSSRSFLAVLLCFKPAWAFLPTFPAEGRNFRMPPLLWFGCHSRSLRQTVVHCQGLFERLLLTTVLNSLRVRTWLDSIRTAIATTGR